METIHITFDELTEHTAPVLSSSGPAPNLLTPGPISSGFVPNSAHAIPYVPPTNNDLELLFQPLFDEYFETPTGIHSPLSLAHQSSSVHHGVATEHSFEVNPFDATEHEPFVNVFAPDPNSEASSSKVITITAPNQSTQPHEHLQKWTDSHPLGNIIRNHSRPISTRKQLATDALWCFYNSVLSKVEPKNFKSAITEDCWFQAMQDEIQEFDRLDEYTIAESDFKDLYPSDFEDLYLLNLQGHLNHLPPKDKKILSTAVNLWIRNLFIRKRVEDFQLGIESYQTQLNLTKPRWEATSLDFMHDYKILNSSRAVVFRDKYGMQMIMWYSEISMECTITRFLTPHTNQTAN
ncbi:hypothetical protein Tco_1552746 [Tanacetum coccineum]